MNQYNSKMDTFLGLDLYNLAMPVTPPADLSLASTLFTPRYLFNRGSGSGALGQVFGFAANDKPYIRGAGFFSNFADGLVEANTSHNGKGLAMNLSVDRIAAALTGTIANTAGNANIVGTATLFTSELCIGATIVWADNNGNLRDGTVLTITDDTHLALSAASTNTAGSMYASVNTTAATAYARVLPGPTLTLEFPTLNTVYPFDFVIDSLAKNLALTGVITFTSASAAVTGLGTSFTTQVSVGQLMRYKDSSGVMYTVKVLSITSDTALSLTAVAAASGTYDAANPGTIPAQLTSFLGVRAKWVNTNAFYTISIDPQYASKQLMFHAVVNLEHNSDLSQSW